MPQLLSNLVPNFAPGRSCPLHYRYTPESFARAADMHCETLYVVGGLYGNAQALAGVLELFEREPGTEGGTKRLVFNGDFHWFDIDPATFEQVSRSVLAHDALRGNVETEIAAADGSADAGCGCAYPDWVGDGVVERSNRILARLRTTAAKMPALTQQLAALPMTLRADVGGLRVAIVHGDATSLAGWGFAQELLRETAHRQEVRQWFARGEVDVFASSHTCAPVFCTLPLPKPSPGSRFHPRVLNNGAAGMPNLRGDASGLLTRISVHRYEGAERRFGVQQGRWHMDAIAIPADQRLWQAAFLAQWPGGSDAHVSYWPRISSGTDYDLAGSLIDDDSPED